MQESSNLEPSGSQRLPQAPLQPEENFSSGPAEVPSSGLLGYWRTLERRKVTVIVIALIGMCAGFLYTVPQTPIYQARTVIEIQSLNGDFLNIKDIDTNTAESDPGTDLQTQVHILQSDALLQQTTERVGAENRNAKAPPSRIHAWRQILHLPERDASTDSAANGGVAISNLRVRIEPGTRLIEILCDSPNPTIAAAFANTLTSEFEQQNLQSRWETTQHTGEFLSNQMQDMRVKLEKSEEAMQAYALDTHLVITDEKDNAEDQKLTQLQGELSKAQADRIDHQSRYELASHAPVDSLAEILDDSSLRDIQSRLTDLRRQYAELSTNLRPADKHLVTIQDQIDSLQAAQKVQKNNILGRLSNDFEAAQRRENLLAADYAATAKVVAEQADKITHYNTLKREVDTDRQLYDNILQRVKEAGVASALRASNIRVVDPAKVPGAPYKPSLLDNTLLGLCAGAIFGITFVIFLDRADRTIQEPGDTSFYLGVPELGIIPSASVDPSRSKRALPLTGHLSAVSSREVALTTLESKPSALAESFRATLTSIMFSGENGVHPQVMVISSASPKEGKTTLSTNLAVALAEIHKRVLLIDGDLRRPSIHRFFNLPKQGGMVELLRREEPIAGPLNGNIRASGVPNLSIMTAGESVHGDSTLLHSTRLVELLEVLRHDFDLILIDTPPMLNMADARVIARKADGVILVARSNVTSRDSLKDAYRRFIEDGTRVIGAVLNDWNPKQSNRFSYYRYYDRYRHYYDGSRPSGETAPPNEA